MGARLAATEAAERAIAREREQTPWLRDWASAAIDAALPLLTPHIAAQALREAAHEFDLFDSAHDQALVGAWLVDRADHLDKAGA